MVYNRWAQHGIPSSYRALPGFSDDLTERFASDLYVLTPARQWPAPFTGRTGTWEREPDEVRLAFRDRARRFMAGNLSVAPWHLQGADS